jgi:hypothetical protein
MRKRTRISAVGSAAAIAAAVFVVGTANPASATPQNCTHGQAGSGSAIATCASGTGSFRSKVKCVYSRWEGDRSYTYGYGPWKAPGGGRYSVSYCPKVGDVYSYYSADYVEISG